MSESEGDQPDRADASSDRDSEWNQIRQLASAVASTPQRQVESEKPIGDGGKALNFDDLHKQQDLKLKKVLSWMLPILLATQVIAANIVVVFYFFVVADEVPPSVMNTWLVSVVGEVIGLAYLMVRYTFPNRDGSVRG